MKLSDFVWMGIPASILVIYIYCLYDGYCQTMEDHRRELKKIQQQTCGGKSGTTHSKYAPFSD